VTVTDGDKEDDGDKDGVAVDEIVTVGVADADMDGDAVAMRVLVTELEGLKDQVVDADRDACTLDSTLDEEDMDNDGATDTVLVSEGGTVLVIDGDA
jgi:hypothetical protein